MIDFNTDLNPPLVFRLNLQQRHSDKNKPTTHTNQQREPHRGVIKQPCPQGHGTYQRYPQLKPPIETPSKKQHN
jgi:hypothetical protein